MTVYLDDWRQPARVGRISGVWSHLTAGPWDDVDELHALAAAVGLRRSWFQDHPWPGAHYDLAGRMRIAAKAARRGGVRLLDPSQVIWEYGDTLFDPARTYRYVLTRTWDAGKPPMVWVMLNPSTATGLVDDPTIGKVIRFARRDPAIGGIIVVNLFACRATKPAVLRTAADPVGPMTDALLLRECAQPGRPVVLAWGAHGALHGRAAHVTGLLAAAGAVSWCLGTTKDGQPLHPLYLAADTPFRPYVPPLAA